MDDCVFCPIGSGACARDADLAVRVSARVFVVPALRQRPLNRGHALVLPVAHVRNLHDASPALLTELLGVAAMLTASFPEVYGANGTMVFQSNVSPDDDSFHLHLHVLPRFDGDDLRVPDPGGVTEVARADRLAQTAVLRRVLGVPYIG